MSIFYEENEIPINEVYFGRVPGLQKAEKLLGQFREKYYNHKFLNDNQADPLLHQYNEIMAETFGFDSFYLRIESSMTINACTYGQSISLKARKAKIKSTKEGFKYDGEDIICIVYIYSSLIFDRSFLDAEIMAIILHEVGHNFSNKRSPLIELSGMYTGACLVLLILMNLCVGAIPINTAIETMKASNTGRKIYKAYLEVQENDSGISYLVNFFHFLKNLPNDLLNTLYYPLLPINILMTIPIRIVQYLIGFLFNPLGKLKGMLDERIADNFCTIYGYGPEQATALEKLRDANLIGKLIHNDVIPITGWLYDFIAIPAWFTVQFFDEHPTTPSRRKDQYNYLISEMKKNKYDKKLVKQIQGELDRMEEGLQVMENNFKHLRGTAVQDKYNLLVNKLSKGDDIRMYFSRSSDKNLDAWDKMYDKGLQEHTNISNIKLI